MESGPTAPSTSGVRHPTLAQLREGSHPDVSVHLQDCAQCQSVIAADSPSAPIPLDLPKGLVSENAFKWPADPIARGGMAQIFAAEDRRLGRTVILKAPRDGDDLAPGLADMFQRRVTAEARILAKLQHPAIVTIHELGKSTVGWPFCVLERVEGTSLRDRLDELAELEKDGKPRTRERLELLSSLVSIAEALAYAHERNVVHRDCTPNNILLGKRGEATLIDWGIARDLDAPALADDAAQINEGGPSASGRMVTISAGTPPYLPYAQTQGRQAEPSFDVYSFGVTLFETVSGVTPFEWRVEDTEAGRAKQLMRFLEWAQSDEPSPPAMPKDRELSGIIARAIDRDADKRFTSEELLRALKQYLTGDLVFSHRYSVTGRLARWARRNRAVAVTVVSLIAFVIAGALVWAQLSRRAKEQAELETIAAGARADAEREGREADEAQRQAADALALADKAQKEGKNSDELRKKADALRSAADSKRRKAEDLQRQARGTAEEAIKRFQEANKIKEEAERERDLARIARADAEKARDGARQAQVTAERDRDSATRAKDNAERERDAAVGARAAAEKERDAAKGSAIEAEKARDAAREGQGAAEKERDAVTAARVAAERERDEALRKIAELEQRLRENSRPAPQPPPPPPGGNQDLE
jgi:tRNA A-37 threonylcarbamoyl transferase component Bud32